MTVRQLDCVMDSRELSEWQAYEKVSGPIGPERTDVQTAMLAAVITASNTAKKDRHKVKVSDFLLKWDQEVEPQPTEDDEMMATAYRLNAQFGGMVANGNPD